MNFIDGTYTDLEKPLLYLHIFAGFVSLGTAYLLLFIKKVTNVIKNWNVLRLRYVNYFCNSYSTKHDGCCSTFLIRNCDFFIFFAFAGYRQAKVRSGARENLDKALTLLMFIAGVMLLLNATDVISFGFYGQFEGLRTVALIFGIGCLIVTAYDLNRFRYTDKPNFYDRTNRHLILMLSGTIAATTAFISTIELFPQEWMNWAMPNVFIVPFIVFFSRRELAKKNN